MRRRTFFRVLGAFAAAGWTPALAEQRPKVVAVLLQGGAYRVGLDGLRQVLETEGEVGGGRQPPAAELNAGLQRLTPRPPIFVVEVNVRRGRQARRPGSCRCQPRWIDCACSQRAPRVRQPRRRRETGWAGLGGGALARLTRDPKGLRTRAAVDPSQNGIHS